MVTYHSACFVVMICQVAHVIGDFEGGSFFSSLVTLLLSGDWRRYFVWPGHQSGPNERKVEMWAFADTKQSIILRNPFLHIYLGGHRDRVLGRGARLICQAWSAFRSLSLILASLKYLRRIEACLFPVKCV